MNPSIVSAAALLLVAGYGIGRVRPIRSAREKALEMLEDADLYGSRADERKAIAAYLTTHPITGLTRTAQYYIRKVKGAQEEAGPEPRRPAPQYVGIRNSES